MAILNSTTVSGSLTVTGNIKENGTLLVNKYLGLTAKAADSDKLDGNDSSYFYPASNPNGYTSNAGTVIGSGLTAGTFVLGNGTVNIQTSTMKPTTSSTSWSATSDVNVPTMKSISSYVTGLGYTTNIGTVTSVGAGTGLSISGTASINPTVNIDTAYKLPTATEWANLVTLSDAQIITGQKTIRTDGASTGGTALTGSGNNFGLTTSISGPAWLYLLSNSATFSDFNMNAQWPMGNMRISATGLIDLQSTEQASSGNASYLTLPRSKGTSSSRATLAVMGDMVRYDTDSQGLTDTQKSNARTNIGAGTSNFTGYTSSNKLSTDYIDNEIGWTTNTGTITGVSVNGTSVATSGVADITSVPWSIISSKPTIPATNVIPAITTANKVLLSTTTSGTASWSSWSSAGFLKTNTSGVVSVDTTSYIPTTLSTSNNQRYLVGSSTTTSASLNTNSSCYMLNGELYSNGKNVAHWHNYLNTTDFPQAPASTTGTTIKRGYAALGCGTTNSTTNKFVIVFGYIPTGTKTTTVTFFGPHEGQGGSSTLVSFTNKPFVITSNYSSGDAQTQRTIPTEITKTGFKCGNNTGQAVAWVAFGFTTATLTN